MRDIRDTLQHGARAPAQRLEAQMRDYKLYCMDSAGHIVLRHDYAALDDLGALDRAKELCGEYEIEVWEGARFAAKVSKDGTASMTQASAQSA